MADKKKVALVTGAGGGIGRAVCERLARDGFAVGLIDIDGPGMETTRTLISEHGVESIAATADISDYEAVRNAIPFIEEALGPITVLVNNAGWDKFSLFLDTDQALRQKIVNINLFGPINLHHIVLAGMMSRAGGRVINIASDAGRVGSTGQAVYSACKGGIIAMTKTLAREMARHDILLNVVCPGPVETAMLGVLLDGGASGNRVHESMKRAIPMRRIGKPEDIAGMVAFLAGEEAGYITGQVISVSGGLTMSG